MKLYAWQPKNHGPWSFFVMANSRVEAMKAVRQWLAENEKHKYFVGGWPDEDEFELTVVGPGVVIINDNS